jgi:hypothetical protein
MGAGAPEHFDRIPGAIAVAAAARIVVFVNFRLLIRF